MAPCPVGRARRFRGAGRHGHGFPHVAEVPEINRRQLLASSAAAAMTVGGGAALAQDSQNNVSVDANPQVDQQNPDLTKPPSTDSGMLPNLKFSFDTAHTHVTTGGWARQVTI